MVGTLRYITWYKKNERNIFGYGLIFFLIMCLNLGGNFPVDGMRNVTNSYITINTAILAVAFAAILIKQGTEGKTTLPKEYFSVITLTAFGIFSSIYALYLSYVPFFPSYTQKVLFSLATAFTFIAIMSMIYLLIGFKPPKE